jgi:hypothetical protein
MLPDPQGLDGGSVDPRFRSGSGYKSAWDPPTPRILCRRKQIREG